MPVARSPAAMHSLPGEPRPRLTPHTNTNHLACRRRHRRHHHQAERRSGAIAEVVNAYAAGLGYRPSTKGKNKRVVPSAVVGTGAAGAGGDGDDGDDGDNADAASEGTSGTLATAASSAGGSSSSSRSRQIPEWLTDGGAGNRWAMGPAARKTLFLSLQAGAVAHLSLKQRRAAEKPWVKVRTIKTLRSGAERGRSAGFGGTGALLGCPFCAKLALLRYVRDPTQLVEEARKASAI